MWIRIVQAYEVAFIPEILWVYHDYKGERIFSNMNNRLKAHERIISKNLAYLENDTNEYWIQLADVFKLCLVVRDWKKAFAVYLKIIRLKPLRLIRNTYILTMPFRIWLKEKNPELFFKLRRIKRKLKGEPLDLYRLESRH